jgi:hypothetical protein
VNEFELTMAVPREPRYAETLRLLAAHGARQAGADEAQAEAFGAEVEREAQALAGRATVATIAVVLRGRAGAIETVMTCGETVRVGRSLAVGA